jgi:hypothetical protein
VKAYVQYILGVVLIVCLGGSSLAYAKFSFTTGVRYDTFSDDHSPEGKGTEITIPGGITYEHDRLFLSVETAYSNANVDSGAPVDSKISSFTDTVISASYMVPSLPVEILLGCDVNLPTGKERPREAEQNAEVGENHDLLEVDNFGEGLNIGLSVGLMKAFGSLSLGITSAYIFNGEFDPTRDIPNDDLDPGDQVFVMATLNWQISSQFSLRPFAAYSHFSTDTVNGRQVFQEGEKVVLGGSIHFDLKPVGIVLNLQQVIQGKDRELVTGTLQTEFENSNGHEFSGLLEVQYAYSAALLLRLLADIRFYEESDRQDELLKLPYEGQRIRYAIGPGFVYTLSKQIACSGLAKYFMMTQEPQLDLEQDTTRRGFNLNVGITYSF